MIDDFEGGNPGVPYLQPNQYYSKANALSRYVAGLLQVAEERRDSHADHLSHAYYKKLSGEFERANG